MGSPARTMREIYRIIRREEKFSAQNHGIAAFAVKEDETSRTCAWRGVKVERRLRGLVHCSHDHTVHADVNAALNILLRGLEAPGVESEPPQQVKVLSFLPTQSRVVVKKRRNHNPAIRRGDRWRGGARYTSRAEQHI